jgi:lipoyl(octanoyl) transferase
MDLAPFSGINPCGLEGQAVTQVADFDIAIDVEQAGRELSELLVGKLSCD